MNIDEKLNLIKELKKINYPSDQELEQIERLEDETRIIANEILEPLKEPVKPILPIPQKKPSLLRTLLRINPPKPVTHEEIERLKNIATAEELKARIRIAKAKAPKANIIQRVLGKSSYNPFDVSSGTNKPRSRKQRSDYDPFRW